jgi:hypothetical protein
MANHLVVLVLDIEHFAFLKGQVVARGGLIYCHILKDGDHYLDVEAHAAGLSGSGQWLHLSIPHHAVLYYISEQNIEAKKILGFHPHSNKDDTPSN